MAAWNRPYPKPPQERMPDELVQQIVLWRDRLRSPERSTLLTSKKYHSWAIVACDAVLADRYFDHAQELADSFNKTDKE